MIGKVETLGLSAVKMRFLHSISYHFSFKIYEEMQLRLASALGVRCVKFYIFQTKYYQPLNLLM